MQRRVSIDWILVLAVLFLTGAGLSVLASLGGGASLSGGFFSRQVIWLSLALAAFFLHPSRIGGFCGVRALPSAST